jgi:hypothetical protein
MNIYIGIDPGINGGIATINNNFVQAYKMPQTIRDLWELIHEIKSTAELENYSITAALESVWSSPQMGVKSAFTFGNGFGHLEMALTALGVPYERVRPAVWQKAMGCLTKQELFPAIKVTHAIADALLIAEFARRAGK